MTTPVTTGATTGRTSAGRTYALATTEIRLVFRNRTVAVSSVVVPLALGLFWALSFRDGDPRTTAMVMSLQLAVVLGMGIYVTATQTVVARRHSRVLARMRTSGLSDPGLLVATVAPSVVLGVLQLVVFAVLDVVFGSPLPADALPPVLAVLGGIALAVTAALATAVLTPSPERSQITTLPLTFVLLAAAVTLAVIPMEGWWQAVILVPGAAVGQLMQLAYAGGTWAPGLAGLPAVLPAVVVLVGWPVVFAALARRWFRWDPRA